jgi:uncharacterized protein (TIRG00374 family)
MGRDAADQREAQRRQSGSSAPLAEESLTVAGRDDDEMPRVTLTRRRLVGFLLFIACTIAFLYFVLPQISGMKESWNRVGEGDHVWLAAAFGFEVLSMASYIAIFQGIHVPPGSRITWRESYLITMAGLAATRLFSAGGAGGVAVTAWALRRSGMGRREVAERMIAFLVLLYGVYLFAMIVCGIGLYAGIFPGPAPFGLTMVPAIIAVLGIAIVVPLALLPDDVERRIERVAARRPRTARWARKLAAGPASAAGGVRFAIERVRRPDAAMIGVVTWWVFNVAVLWASFKAFGDVPPLAVVIQGYFVGMLGNLLPLPAGIGGVDGGMIGAFVAFGVDGGLAVVAVLAYRLFAFWLPTLPGAIAYLQLRRRVQEWQGDAARA